MPRLRATPLHAAVAIGFALLALLSPLGDALAFGLHDHVAAADVGDPTRWISSDDSGLTPAHHCELSMSPLAFALEMEVPVLRSSGPTPPAPSLPASGSAPSVPLSPPRV